MKRADNDAELFLRHLHAPCPTCGYDMGGLVRRNVSVCPECGGRWALDELQLNEPRDVGFKWMNLMWSLVPGLVLIAEAELIRWELLPLTIAGLVFFLTLIVGPLMIAGLAWDALQNVEMPDRKRYAGALIVPLIVANGLIVAGTPWCSSDAAASRLIRFRCDGGCCSPSSVATGAQQRELQKDDSPCRVNAAS